MSANYQLPGMIEDTTKQGYEGFKLLCPLCGFDYNHFSKCEIENGNDDYDASWSGRGDLTVLKFWGECGHNWELCIGFHKGQSFIFARRDKAVKLESPIEEMFWDAAAGILDDLEPQYKAGPFRIDFAIPDRSIAIELDGHDYHKTKKQRTSDAQRERYLIENGWQVIRFTGTEVFKDVAGCVRQVKRIIDKTNGKTESQPRARPELPLPKVKWESFWDQRQADGHNFQYGNFPIWWRRFLELIHGQSIPTFNFLDTALEARQLEEAVIVTMKESEHFQHIKDTDIQQMIVRTLQRCTGQFLAVFFDTPDEPFLKNYPDE